MVSPVIPALIGLGGGAAIGYIVGTIIGEKLPQIILQVSGQEIPKNRMPIGTVYDFICLNFPPNSQLVAPMALAPSEIGNLGVTDSNGTLVLRGIAVRGPVGIYYLIAWNAVDGKYCAMATLIAT